MMTGPSGRSSGNGTIDIFVKPRFVGVPPCQSTAVETHVCADRRTGRTMFVDKHVKSSMTRVQTVAILPK